MITRLKVANFRSIGDSIDLELGPLTALVGTNSSGKSNILDALRFLADCLHLGLESAVKKREGAGNLLHRRSSVDASQSNVISFSAHFVTEEMTGEYHIELGVETASRYEVLKESGQCQLIGQPLESFAFERVGTSSWIGPEGIHPRLLPRGLVLPLLASDARFSPLASQLDSLTIYAPSPGTLRRPQHEDMSRPMSEGGENWYSILQELDSDLPRRAELREAIYRLTGDVKDFVVCGETDFRYVTFLPEESPPLLTANGATGKRSLPGRTLGDAYSQSDGTLRFACLLTALIQDPLPSLIGIEEPELYIHPGALPMMYDFLDQAASTSQVLVSTHSPELLGLFRPKNVRVVERHHGMTTVAQVESSQSELVRKRLFTFGELMVMEGLRQDVAHSQVGSDGRQILEGAEALPTSTSA